MNTIVLVVESSGFRVRQTWAWIPDLPFSSCWPWTSIFNMLSLGFFIWMWNSNSPYIIALLGGLKAMAYVQYLACEMHSTVDNCCLLQSYCNYYWPYKASGIVLKDPVCRCIRKALSELPFIYQLLKLFSVRIICFPVPFLDFVLFSLYPFLFFVSFCN